MQDHEIDVIVCDEQCDDKQASAISEQDFGKLILSIDSTDTIDISNIISGSGDFSMDSSASYNYNYGNITISNGTSVPVINSNPYIFSTSNPGTDDPGSLTVKGDAEFEGDVKIKGKSILTMLETIEKRLLILQPDPEKLEHFESLRKAYEHYKTLEALCELPAKEEE